MTVTGSSHLVTTDKSEVLLDAGLFQGHRDQFNIAGVTEEEIAHVDALCQREGVESRSRLIRLLIARAFREATAPTIEEKPQ